MPHHLHVTTPPDYTGELPFARAPGGSLTFEDGETTVADDVDVDWLVARYPNLEPVPEPLDPAPADAEAADTTDDADETDDADDADGAEEDADAEDGADADAAADADPEPLLDPSDYTVPELRDALADGDFSAGDLEGIRTAEETGDNRNTALDAIDAALED